jgi:hypothetical protein
VRNLVHERTQASVGALPFRRSHLDCRFSLQFIPAFVIREIRVTENPAGYSSPLPRPGDAVVEWKERVLLYPAEMERALSSDPLILKAQVRRRGAVWLR